MKGFIEKLIERLEERKLIRVEQCHEDYEIEVMTESNFDDAIEIVNELAEEHINTSTDTSTDTSTTNADAIRSMTDEELAEFLCKLDTMGTEPKSLWNGEFWIDEGEELLNWLQSEVEGE